MKWILLFYSFRKNETKNNGEIIAFAMGEKGEFTRVTAPLVGSPITYASIEIETAPGQLNLSTVKEILEKYRD